MAKPIDFLGDGEIWFRPCREFGQQGKQIQQKHPVCHPAGPDSLEYILSQVMSQRCQGLKFAGWPWFGRAAFGALGRLWPSAKVRVKDFHKQYKHDTRWAHEGTMEYTSRDAHIGCASRRGDLEASSTT